MVRADRVLSPTAVPIAQCSGHPTETGSPKPVEASRDLIAAAVCEDDVAYDHLRSFAEGWAVS